MFWLVEDDKQLEVFKNYVREEAFVEIIPYSNVEHPTKGGICAVYIRPLNAAKGFILTNDHSETLNVGIDAIKCVLDTLDKVYVRDKKEFLHYLILQKLFDITLTTRPANKFNGINYAALNKDNGCRKSFIPRNDKFIELDIGAYHPTLLGLLVGYDFGDEDIHKAFAKMYGVDYQKSKELTFKQLYGGVFEQFKDLEFFQRVQIYVDDLWQRFNEEGYIECPVSKHVYRKDKLDDMKPQKLLNYVLQNLETAMNVRILWDIFKSLRNRKTELVLYTYDSFLFDFKEGEEDLIDEIKQIIKKYKLQIKESYGSDYDFR